LRLLEWLSQTNMSPTDHCNDYVRNDERKSRWMMSPKKF